MLGPVLTTTALSQFFLLPIMRPPMKSFFIALAMLTVSSSAFAVQETFLTADCSAVTYCFQNTADGLFRMQFLPTYPISSSSTSGFNVNQSAIEIYSNGASGLLDLSILQISLTGSNSYNGQNFIGAIQIETLDDAGTWTYVTQWSTYINSARGIYVLFNGENPASPFIKG
jgi:hypothetical protein